MSCLLCLPKPMTFLMLAFQEDQSDSAFEPPGYTYVTSNTRYTPNQGLKSEAKRCDKRIINYSQTIINMLNMCRTRCRGTLPTIPCAVAFEKTLRYDKRACREVEAAFVSHRDASRSRFRLKASPAASSFLNNSRLDSNLALFSLNFFFWPWPQWRHFFWH